jgi:hypothetical protein
MLDPLHRCGCVTWYNECASQLNFSFEGDVRIWRARLGLWLAACKTCYYPNFNCILAAAAAYLYDLTAKLHMHQCEVERAHWRAHTHLLLSA